MTGRRRLSRRVALRLAACGLLTVFALGLPVAAGADTPPTIAVAASLRYALDEIAERFAAETGQQVRITYGATGSLVHQIEAGAPFQLFLAADDLSVTRLAEKGRTEGEPVVFARGRIALVAPKGSPVAVDGDLEGLKEALGAGKVRKFAIANPEVAPYGRAAREALQHQKLWGEIAPRLVIGENVGQAAQFATTGAVQAGIIANSLAIAEQLAPKINAAMIPETFHNPINHGMALIKGAGPVARAFAAFIRENEQSRAILERNGFSVP